VIALNCDLVVFYFVYIRRLHRQPPSIFADEEIQETGGLAAANPNQPSNQAGLKVLISNVFPRKSVDDRQLRVHFRIHRWWPKGQTLPIDRKNTIFCRDLRG
jgi:hypothetical protein